MKKLILFILPMFLYACLGGVHYDLPVDDRRVYLGLENMTKWHSGKYKGKRCVLVTNHSGADRYLETNVALLNNKGIKVIALIAPEHGIYGYQNEYSDETSMRGAGGMLVYNMHKLSNAQLKKILTSGDFVAFDIQDMGMRCYTYITNLKFVMDALNGTSTELVVLDRPNPIGFLKEDGPFLDNRFTAKYITAFPAPFIYNMTIGEAARYYKGEYAKDVRLTVFPMVGYKRNMFYHDTGMPWVPPSPNLPTYKSAIVYSGVVLMECINLSLGRGTPMPFEYIGAPWIEPVRFCKDLEKLGLEAFKFRPVYFKPLMRRYSGQVCGGAHIIYTGKKFIPTEVSYKICAYLLKNYPQARWDIFQGKYEIDYMASTDKFRESIEKGLSFKEYQKLILPDVKSFKKKRSKYTLYR